MELQVNTGKAYVCFIYLNKAIVDDFEYFIIDFFTGEKEKIQSFHYAGKFLYIEKEENKIYSINTINGERKQVNSMNENYCFYSKNLNKTLEVKRFFNNITVSNDFIIKKKVYDEIYFSENLLYKVGKNLKVYDLELKKFVIYKNHFERKNTFLVCSEFCINILDNKIYNLKENYLVSENFECKNDKVYCKFRLTLLKHFKKAKEIIKILVFASKKAKVKVPKFIIEKILNNL